MRSTDHAAQMMDVWGSCVRSMLSANTQWLPAQLAAAMASTWMVLLGQPCRLANSIAVLGSGLTFALCT